MSHWAKGVWRFLSMKVETTLPLQNEARILQFTKDESLASFQWCLLWIAHNYSLINTIDKQNAYLTKLSA